MKKIVALLFAALLAVSAAGCYIITPARKSKVVGTYKLESYTNDGVNLIEKNGIVCYLVVNESGGGYYVYKDNSTPLSVKGIQTRLIPDEDNSRKYSYVEFLLDHLSGTADDWDRLGYSNGGLNKNETKFHPIVWGEALSTYQISTRYTRISKAQDLSAVSKELGELPNAMAFGEARYDGVYVYNHNETSNPYNANADSWFYENCPVHYLVVDFNVATKKADVYYMLLEDKTQQHVQVDFTMAGDQATIGEAVAKLEYYPSATQGRITFSTTFTFEEVVYSAGYILVSNKRHQFNVQEYIQGRIDALQPTE